MPGFARFPLRGESMGRAFQKGKYMSQQSTTFIPLTQIFLEAQIEAQQTGCCEMVIQKDDVLLVEQPIVTDNHAMMCRVVHAVEMK